MHRPEPNEVRKRILENPKSWQRVYLTYMASYLPDYLDAKFADDSQLHAQIMGFKEHGWHRLDKHFEITDSKDQRDKTIFEFFNNFDNMPQTKGWWRKIFCGKDYDV